MTTLRRYTPLLALLLSVAAAHAAPPEGKGGGNKGGGGGETSLSTLSDRNWDDTAVRRVLQAFAYGGLATDEQVAAWDEMSPSAAIVEMLTFDAVNEKLSPSEASDDNALHCHSLEAMQAFWGGDDPGNIMKYADRDLYRTLNNSQKLSEGNLRRTWTKVISTRGCNPFLHKVGLFLTNYLASVSVSKTKPALIRDYYDELLAALMAGEDFVGVMTRAATHAAVARAYGHQYNKFYNGGRGFVGNDDFARELHQLFFRNYGETEDPAYHEDVTIENTAWLLTGMNLDKEAYAYGSISSGDWWVAPIDFTDHYDLHTNPRRIRNSTYHYDSTSNSQSCLEVLDNEICGANAGEKLASLVPVAASHPESMANLPVYTIDFFADDNLTDEKISKIRAGWEEANFDLLAFLQAYAISTTFHDQNTYKFRTAFDRNLLMQNQHILTNEENFGRDSGDSPYGRMQRQDAEVFEPVHDVFGGQTGLQAAGNRYIFKDAISENIGNPTYFDDYSDRYTLEAGTETEPAPSFTWTKDWAAVVPVNDQGDFRVGDVATWLWNRFMADGGKNFDDIARAQVQSFLASGHDFGYAFNPDDAERSFGSRDFSSKKGIARPLNEAHADTLMNDLDSKTFNKRIGMAINFISMLPYAFVTGGI